MNDFDSFTDILLLGLQIGIVLFIILFFVVAGISLSLKVFQ